MGLATQSASVMCLYCHRRLFEPFPPTRPNKNRRKLVCGMASIRIRSATPKIFTTQIWRCFQLFFEHLWLAIDAGQGSIPDALRASIRPLSAVRWMARNLLACVLTGLKFRCEHRDTTLSFRQIDSGHEFKRRCMLDLQSHLAAYPRSVRVKKALLLRPTAGTAFLRRSTESLLEWSKILTRVTNSVTVGNDR